MMKQLLIYAGIGFAAFQVLLVFAVLAAAARPTPEFEPEIVSQPKEFQPEEELELVS